jgi:copper(I)-binding protein
MKSLFFTVAIALTAPAWAANHEHTPQTAPSGHAASTVTIGPMTLSNFKARASIGQMKNSAAYGDIQIKQGSDRLVRASTPSAERVELHEHINDDGVMRMREVDGGFVVSEDQPLQMKPGGFHIMLIGLSDPLMAETDITLTLGFASGIETTIQVPVVNVQQMMHH